MTFVSQFEVFKVFVFGALKKSNINLLHLYFQIRKKVKKHLMLEIM